MYRFLYTIIYNIYSIILYYREPGYETVSDLRRGSGLTSLDPDYESVANNNNRAGNGSSRSGGGGQDPGNQDLIIVFNLLS